MQNPNTSRRGGLATRLGLVFTGLLGAGLVLLVACRHTGALSEGESSQGGGQAVALNGPLAAFDVNDLAIMLPNQNGHFYPEIALDQASTSALGLRDLWPQTAFQPLLAFAGGKDFTGDTAFLTALTGPGNAQPLGQFGLTGASRPAKTLGLTANQPSFSPVHRQIGVYIAGGHELNDTGAQVPLNATFTDESKWRLVSVRFDPCATAEGAKCTVEMRLIAQPVVATAFGAVKPLDRSAHLLFHLGNLDVANARFDPALPRAGLNKTFRDLITDLQNFKALATAAGASTDGKPLGVHPGLLAEMGQAGPTGSSSPGPLAKALMKLINDYAAGGLSAVTSMQLTGTTSPWVFFQGSVVNNTWHPIGITGGNPQFSIRFVPAAASFLPPPVSSPQTSTLLNIDPESGTDAAGSTLALAYQVDNPGRYGADDGQPKASVVTIDCLSCHSTLSRLSADTAAGSATNVPANLAAMYIPAAGITGYPAPREVAQFVWNFRNFGVFGALSSPTVMSRTVNEAAEAARFVDEDLMPKIFGVTPPKHGFICKDHAGTDHALLHAKLWDCTVIQGGDFDQCTSVLCPASPSVN